MRLISFTCLLLILFAQGCASAPRSPPDLAIPAAAIAAQTSASKLLADLAPIISDNFTDVESVVVMRGGAVIFEHYKTGADADTLRETQSVTKSILSLLVGIAIDDGSITGLNAPLDSISAEQKSPIMLRHLLTMTSGFEAAGGASWADSDRPQYLLRRAIVAPPGSVFRYDNLSANLLSIVLEKAVNQTAESYAQSKLFEPLGIDIFKWQKGANGHSYGSGGLKLRTRDMAKLGQLMLQEGAWNNQQLLSKLYVRTATQRQTAQGMPPYGFLWWLADAAKNTKANNAGVRDAQTTTTAAANSGSNPFYASGFGGQIIWVQPALDVVVATTAAAGSASQNRGQAMGLIRENIIPRMLQANTLR
jgi:CubicO group peptidase (beta-lactamase class C family)